MELPLRLLQPFLGPRIIKTGVAVFLSLGLFHWFGSSYATFAAVAAVLAVQPTVSKAREVFRQQLLGNLVAGVVATALGLTLPINPVTMALGSILVLGLLVRLKLTEAAGLAVVVVLFIMDRPQHDFIMYTAARLASIAGGMAIGYLVNRFLRPHDVTQRALHEIQEGAQQIDHFLVRLMESLPSPERFLKAEIKQEAAAIQSNLSSARAFLELAAHEADPGRIAVLKKANGSMFIFTEAVMDIHKLVLQVNGLPEGEELIAIREALEAIRHYKDLTMQRALAGTKVDPEPGAAFGKALARLEGRIHDLVDQPDQRTFGLHLHQVMAEIRHMGWRMDSLTRLANTYAQESETTGQGGEPTPESR